MAADKDMEEYVFVEHMNEPDTPISSVPAATSLPRPSWRIPSTSEVNDTFTKLKDFLPLYKMRVQNAEPQVCRPALHFACLLA